MPHLVLDVLESGVDHPGCLGVTAVHAVSLAKHSKNSSTLEVCLSVFNPDWHAAHWEGRSILFRSPSRWSDSFILKLDVLEAAQHTNWFSASRYWEVNALWLR